MLITPRTSFWLSFGFFVALAVPWALATPLGAAPDEASHITAAAGVVRGQLVGVERADSAGRHVLDLPPAYGELEGISSCYRFRPEVSAACARPLEDLSAAAVPVETTAGRYNPLYSALVGLPSLLPPSTAALYAMRLASILLASATLAAAVRSVVETARPRWAVLGVAVAVLPMVVFLSATVNPSTVEITAALGLWATLLAALADPHPDLVRRRMLRAGVLVALLVNAKALSPVLLAVVVLSVVAVFPWRATRDLVTDRRAWPGLAVGTVGAVAAVAWIVVIGAVARPADPPFPELTPRAAVEQVLLRADPYLANMIGVFGAADAGMPTWAYVLGGGLVLLLGALALAVGIARERLVLLGLAAVVAALPLVLQVPQATQLGLPWQGRYALPVAVGLPVLSGFVLARHRAGLGARLTAGLTLVVAATWAVLQLTGLVSATRRFTVGAAWPWLTAQDVAWQPPVAEVVILLAGAGLCVLGAVGIHRLASGGGAADGGADPDPDRDPVPAWSDVPVRPAP